MKKAKIILKDEVNCKLQDLDLDVRKKLTNLFQYDIPGARFSPAVKLGRWNGKVSYFSFGGGTYTNLLEEIIPILDDYGYDLELVDQRIKHPEFVFEEVTEKTFEDVMWPKGHVCEGQPIVLRDYQIKIVNDFLLNLQSIQQAATGSGKTLVTAALSKCVENYGRTIVIVPSKTLVVQTEADYINLGLDVGVYFGDRKEYNKTHTICTWQSLNNIFKDKEIGREFIDKVICVITDEAHQASANVLRSLLTGPLANIPIRWGFTGTIPKEKLNQTTLLICIGPVIGELSAAELQEKGILANCHVEILQLVDDVQYKDYQSELKYLLENEKRLDKLASLIENANLSGNTLVLVDRIHAGKELVHRLGDKAVFIQGATKLKERKENFDEVATSTDKIIISTYKLSATGINIPRLFNIVLIEPGKAFVRVIQSIGRGLRMAPDKDFVNILDLTSNCKYSKRHLTQRKAFYKEAEYPFTVKKVIY